MKQLLSATVIFVGVIVACGTVNATTRTSALVCQPAGGTVGAQLAMSNYGWYNSGTADAYIWCGLSTQAGASPRALTIRVYDRNSNANQDVSCEVWGIDAGGGTPYHEFFTSTGSGGGAQFITNSVSIATSVNFYAASCKIPQRLSVGNYSFVTEFAVD